jgi:CheY-like chemotaxis protein
MMELFRGMKVVGHAGDGEEACLLYKQLCPDILILNLRIPKKAGIEVVIELRPQKSCPQKQTRVSARHAIESSLRSTPNSQTPDRYAKGGPAVSQWTAAGQFPPPFDLVETPAGFSLAHTSQIEAPVWLIEMEE